MSSVHVEGMANQILGPNVVPHVDDSLDFLVGSKYLWTSNHQ